MQMTPGTRSLLALGEGPREGGPGRGRIVLLLSGEDLSLDNLHLTAASLGGDTGAGYLAAAGRARQEGAPALCRLLLDLALEVTGAGPRVVLPGQREIARLVEGLDHGLPRGTPVTWTDRDVSMRIYHLGTWPVSPYRPGLLLEYRSEAAGDPRRVASEADWLAEQLSARHPTLAGHFETVVLAPRDEVISPDGDPLQTAVLPQTVRQIPWDGPREAADAP